ncbi:MAG: FecR domain-containing protein [Fimbriimonadaceae bacterium]|nr:MAG: FecR domain-containing protein [Fimbriimonadaceae bacterium]
MRASTLSGEIMANLNVSCGSILRMSFLWVAALLIVALSPLASAQTHYKLVRTEVTKHVAGGQPETSRVEGGLKSMDINTSQPSFTSTGKLSISIPDRVENDQQTFSASARIDASWNLKSTVYNLNVGVNLIGSPKTVGKGDPGPWPTAGSHSLSVEVAIETSFAANNLVRKWSEGGKNYRSFSISGHTGVVQTLSGFSLTYIYEETKSEVKAEARPGRVEVLAVVGEVELSPGGDDSRAYELKPGDRINRWDRIVTGMDSSVKLRFEDGTVVDVSELTDMKVLCFIDAGAAVQTRLWIRGGEISASVNRSVERPSSFDVKTPTATCGVRGTKFTVRFHKQTGVATVRVTEGRVEVTPVNPSIQPVTLAPGQSAEVTLEGPIRPSNE